MSPPTNRSSADSAQGSPDKGKKRRFLPLPVQVLLLGAIIVGLVALIAVGRLEKSAPPVPHSAGPSAESPSPARPAEGSNPENALVRRPSRSPASTGSDDQLLEEAVGRLKKGQLAYNTPDKMKTGQTAHVIARIGSEGVSLKAMEEGMPTGNETTTATTSTPVSTKMKMTLKSADFDITPLASDEQFVIGDSPTTWEWDIIPKHSGKLGLHLAAVVELNNLSKDFTTVDREIAVQVDPIDAATRFARENGVWVLTTLGAAGAGGWAWLKRRKKSKAPARENP